MTGPVIFQLGFEDSKAYAQVNALANHASRSFSNIKGNPFASLNGGLNRFNKTLDSTNDRFVAFGATASIIYGVGNAFKSLFGSAIAVEKALAEIQVNVRTTSSELQTLSSGLFDVANETGQSFFTAAAAAAEFGRQGLKLNQILDATHAALVLTQTTGLDSVSAVQSLTAAVNTFTKEGLSYADIVNKMAAADTSFAVSSKDLAEGVRRVGSTALDANIKYEELLATITALQQKTSRGGGVIGNSLKTIFTRLQREDTSTALEGLGVQTKTADGEFRNQLAVISDLAKAYDNLSASQRASVSEMVGGVYQINIIKALFQDLSKESSVYAQALGVVQTAQNDAFVKSEFLSGTTASKLTALKNEFVELGGIIGNMGLNKATKGIASELASVLDFVNDSLTSSDETQSTGEEWGKNFVKGIVASVTGPGLAIFARSMAQFGGKVLGGISGDIKNQVSLSGVAKTQTNSSNIIAENKLKAASLEAENQIYKAIIQGNVALADRRKLIAQIVAAQSGMGGMGSGFGGSIAPQVVPVKRRNFASGYDPLQTEISQIAAGVGGASKGAKPVLKTISTSPGKKEKVVVNSDEWIIGNYMGSGADAVFNKDMVRKVGGIANLKKFGSASRALATGNVPFSKRGVKDLISILSSGSAIQKKGAINELKKRGYFSKASSIGLGIPASMISDSALIKGMGGNMHQSVVKELGNRGTFNDPTSVRRGMPLASLSGSALGKIAKDTKYSQFPAAMVTGAQNLRNQKLQQAQAQRAAQVQQRQVAARIAAARKEKIEHLQIARKEAAAKKVEQRRLTAQSAFRDYVSQNPYANKKQLNAAAAQVGSETRSTVSSKDIKAASKETRVNRNQRFASKSIMPALVGAAAGNMVGSAIGGKTGDMISSLSSNIASLGSLGASFGPAGAAAGAAAGAFLSVADAMKKTTIPLEKFEKIVGDLGATSEKQQAAVQKYFTSRDSLKGLMADPNASLKQIQNQVREKASALADLPPDLRKKILSTDDAEKQGEIAQDFMFKQARKNNATTAFGAIASTAEKENSAIGLFLRKLTASGADDSIVKMGDLNKGDAKANIESFVNSIVNSINLKDLQEVADGGGPNSSKAKDALNILNSGKADFVGLSRALDGLGVAADDMVATFNKDFIPNLKGAELTAFNNATSKATSTMKELEVSVARDNQQKKLEKSAVIDMQRYIRSSTSRDAAKNTIDEIGSKATRARFGFLAQDPGNSSGFKNVLDTAQELVDINSQERRVDRDSSVQAREFAKKLSLELGKGEIDKSLGSDYLANLLSDANSEDNIAGVIDKLNSGVSKLQNVSEESLTQLQELGEEYAGQRAALQAQRQTALEQLTVLQSIDKKQKFDELLNQFRQNTPADRANEKIQFQMLRNKIFNPSFEDKRKKQEELDNARRSEGSTGLRNIIAKEAFRAKDMLDLNDKEKARGEPGLTDAQISKLNKDIIKDQIVNSYGIQSDNYQQGAKERGNISVFNAMKRAERSLTSGGGSVNSINSVIGLLKGTAGQISNPEDADKQNLLSLAESLGDQLKGLISGTDLFKDLDTSIAKSLADVRSVENPEGKVTAEDAAILKKIQEALGRGDKDAAFKESKAGKGSIFEDIQTGLQFIRPEDTQKALDSRVNKPKEALDVASVLKGDLVPSQNKLNVSLISLNDSINRLNAIMLNESRIALSSAGGAAVNSEMNKKNLELNSLVEQRKGMNKITPKDESIYKDNLWPFINKNVDAVNKASFDGKVEKNEVKEAEDFLKNIRDNKYSGGEADQRGFDTLKKIRGLSGVGVTGDDEKRQEFIQAYRKSINNNETSRASDLDKQIEQLTETIKQLGEQFNKNAEETNRLRKDSVEAGEVIKEPKASGGNLSVNVTGLDGSSMASLKDDIGALVQEKFKEMIGLSRDNPRLFDSLMS